MGFLDLANNFRGQPIGMSRNQGKIGLPVFSLFIESKEYLDKATALFDIIL